MKLKDLKNVIPGNCDVGLTDKEQSDLPFVDTWNNWMNGGLKTMDVDVIEISSCGYLLIRLDV